MPDCHRGTTAAGQEDFLKWCQGYSWESHIKLDFDKMMTFLADKGAASVGAIGFCWGVWAYSKASAEGVALKCGVGCHPSTKLEGWAFPGSELALVQAVRMPCLSMPAGNDGDNLKPGGDCHAAIDKAGGSTVVFPEMSHGACAPSPPSSLATLTPAFKTSLPPAWRLF